MQKGFAALLILIPVLILALVGGGYYFLKIQAPKAVVQNPVVSQTLKPIATMQTTPTPTPDENENANWKTYRDAKYNYSVKYPSDWTIGIDTDNKVSFFPPGADIIANTPQNNPGSGIKPQILISFLNQPFVKPTGPISQLTTLNINGLDGYYYHMLGAPVSPWIFDLPFSNGNGIIRFELISLYENIDIFNKKYGTNVQDADEKTFNQILSTFKFTQ